MFPHLSQKANTEKSSNLACDTSKIDKAIFCQETCVQQVCPVHENSNVGDDESANKIAQYSAEGVYAYYKSFVAKFLEKIDYEVSFQFST